MTDIVLTPEQREVIRKHVKAFRAYQKTSQGQDHIKTCRERVQFFQTLDREGLEQLDEALLREIVEKLWASQMWSSKEYPVQKILSNGLERVRCEFVRLFYDGVPASQRYDRFIKHVKGFGPASVTEMLCYRSPSSFGIWNETPRKALGLLGFGDDLPLKKYQLSADEYDRFNGIVTVIAQELRDAELKEMDLLGTDRFLWAVSQSSDTGTSPLMEGWEHNEIRDKLEQIGSFLGFTTETEKFIAQGARVDVVWRADIGNLGVVTYVFEVQKGGSVDSLILNLQKATGNATVQKVVAVSDTEQLGQIQKETQGLPEKFVSGLAYWDAAEVLRVHEWLSQATESIRQLGLVKDSFQNP